MAFKLASLFVEIGAQDSALNRTIAGIKGRFADLAKVRFNVPGGGFAAALGGGATIAGALKTAADLESRMVALAKATDLGGAALAEMKAGLLALSTSLRGVRLDDLIDIATSGAKMGVATRDLLQYAEGIAKVSTAIDDMPAGEIADRIGKLNTVFKLGVQGSMQLGSAIDKLADSGVSSASGILDVTARISGSAVAARISAQEATALAAALLDTGTRSEEAASSLLDLIASLNQVQGRKHIAAAIGMDLAEFSKLVEEKPVAALQRFLAQLKTMGAGGQMKVLAEVGIKGDTHAAEIMKLAQQADALGKYVGMANSEFLTLDQITKSYNASADTTGARLATMQNQLQILGDRIGSALLPAANAGLGLIGDLATGLGGMLDGARAGVESWGVDFSAVVDTLGYEFRNFGDLFERTGVMIGGVLLGAWDYLSYGGDVAKEVGRYIWESLVEAFGFVMTAAKNMKDNLVQVLTEVRNYVKSGFKDPIEFKLKPLMEGAKFVGDNQFKMPDFKANGREAIDDQLAEIDRRIADREAKRAGAKAVGNGPVPGGPAQAAPGGASPAAAAKGGLTDIDTYLRDAQDAALKGGDVQRDQLRVAQSMDRTLEQIAKNTAIGAATGGRGGAAAWG